MKVFVLALLLVAVVSVHAGDKEMYMLKKWAMHKACESCIGEENSKKFMVKIKKAYAKCHNLPTPPELSLPVFQAPHRVAGSLVHAAFHNHGIAEKGHGHDDQWMDKAVRKFFMKKMFKSFMREQFAMDDEDEYDEDMMESPMRFFKASRRHSHSNRRYKRDVSSEMMDLGEKLTEKLEMEQMKMEAKIGNMTCMLQECGIIDEEKNLVGVETIINNMNSEFTIEDPWLAEEFETLIRKCHMFASSIPEEFFEDCTYPTYIGRVKMFKMCKKIGKLRTCMNYDIKQKIEKNFAPLEDLMEETQMREQDLLQAIYHMLHGPEMNMH